MIRCRNSPQWLWVAAAVLIAPSAMVAGAEEPPAATFSAEEIRAGIAKAQDRLFAFRIEYEVEYPSDADWPSGTYLRRTVAVMSPGLFFHESAHGHQGISWQDDPRRRRTWIAKDQAVDEWVNNRSYNWKALAPSDELPGSMPTEFLIHATGLWPLRDRPAPRSQDRPVVLPEIAQSEQYNTVRPRQEKCDGVWCHVLESDGVDTLWIDTHRACTLMARETRDIRSGHLIERIELGGHCEVNPDIWLPTWIHNVQFDFRASTAEERNQRILDSTLRMLRTEVNEDVAPSFFEFTPPAGALWLNPPDGKPIQTSDAGEELLDYWVDWARRYLPAERSQLPLRSKLFPFGVAAALLFIVEVLLWRQRCHQGSRNAAH